LIKLDFGSGKAEAAILMHDVVVADDAFMPERANALELFGSGMRGLCLGGAGRRAKAVVVGEEAAQHVGHAEIFAPHL